MNVKVCDAGLLDKNCRSTLLSAHIFVYLGMESGDLFHKADERGGYAGFRTEESK